MSSDVEKLKTQLASKIREALVSVDAAIEIAEETPVAGMCEFKIRCARTDLLAALDRV